jgi:hypothetical protein
MEFAVTAVVATVAVPELRATVPNELAPAVVVEATEVLLSLLPAVPRTTLPLVAVMAPKVAVRVVVVVRLPVTAVFPVALPMLTAPVPPVPIVVTAEPVVLIPVVPVILAPPAVTVNPVAAVTEPEKLGDPVHPGSAPVLPMRAWPVAPTAVAAIADAPSPSNTPWAVKVVSPVPPFGTERGAAISRLRVCAPPVTVIVPPEEVIVEKAGSAPVEPIKSCPLVPAAVAAIELEPSPSRTPWAVYVAGVYGPIRERVIVLPEPAVVIWLDVPAMVMLPADGEIAPPESPVNVSRAPPLVAKRVQLAVVTFSDAEKEVRQYSAFPSVLTHRFPTG